MALYLLVSSRFQVLFHSPPGVLFTFPSRYYSLSVTWSYLAFWDGPHFFQQDFSCPAVLWIPLRTYTISSTGVSPSSLQLSSYFNYCFHATHAVRTPQIFLLAVWAAPISLATTFGITFVFFSFGYLDVSVPRVPLVYLSIQYTITYISIR